MRNQFLSFTPSKSSMSLDRSICGQWGQSNRVGFTFGVDPTDIKYHAPSQNVIIYNGSQWEVLDLTTNQGLTHGAEMSFAYSAQNTKIVKVAQGSTGLQEHWFVNSTLKNRLISELNEAITDYPDHDIRIFQNQWERDGKDDPEAINYYDNLVEFYQDLQSKINKTITDVIISLPNESSNTWVNYPVIAQKVKSAMELYAQNYGAKLVATNDLVFGTDNAHYTSDSYITLGEREYEQAIKKSNYSAYI